MIVLLRPILNNLTAIMATQQQLPPGMAGRGNNPGVNGGPMPNKNADGTNQAPREIPEPTPEEVDAARTREITSKAMTGILLLLLKWLKLSRKCGYFKALNITDSARQMFSSSSI